MLAQPLEGQPLPTRIELAQDLGVLLNLFDAAQRRLAAAPGVPHALIQRGNQACGEAVDMIAELVQMVRRGLNRQHYVRLLQQVRATVKGIACHEIYLELANANPETTPVHPADVLALQEGGEEATSREGQTVTTGDLMEARNILCNFVAFLEEPIAEEIRGAVRAIDRWLASWWGEEIAVVVEDSQDVQCTTHPSGGSSSRAACDTGSGGGRTLQQQDKEQGKGKGNENKTGDVLQDEDEDDMVEVEVEEDNDAANTRGDELRRRDHAGPE